MKLCLNALLFYDVVIRRKRKSSIRLIGLTDFVFQKLTFLRD